MGPLPIYCYKESYIALTKNPCHHNRPKHIDITHQYLHEKVEHGDIEVLFCPT